MMRIGCGAEHMTLWPWEIVDRSAPEDTRRTVEFNSRDGDRVFNFSTEWQCRVGVFVYLRSVSGCSLRPVTGTVFTA